MGKNEKSAEFKRQMAHMEKVSSMVLDCRLQRVYAERTRKFTSLILKDFDFFTLPW